VHGAPSDSSTEDESQVTVVAASSGEPAGTTPGDAGESLGESPGEIPDSPDETRGDAADRPLGEAEGVRGEGATRSRRLRPPSSVSAGSLLLVPAWLLSLSRRHKTFTAVLGGGALLRMIAMLGYRPASWFNDSFDYLHVAMSPYPHPIRPDGYSFLLWALKPFHSFAVVAGVQHLMGLASAVMVYALLRRRFGLPGWGASLATVPLLYDAYEIQLEHLILSDVMFEFLLVSVVTILLWHGKELTWRMGGVAGVLLGLATLTRTVGEPVLLAVVVYFLVRRIRWRVLIATVLLCALPLAAYAGWFWTSYGKPGMTTSSGVFLYARVTEFADCNKMKPPVSEYPLCKDSKTSHTPLTFSQDAIWDRNSPFHRIPAARFTDYQNQIAGDFAKRAIMAQPLDYARVVAKDFLFTFKWRRTVFPDRATYEMYQFGKKSAALPNWRMSRDHTAASEAAAYEEGNARTRIIDPYATTIRIYQKGVHLPGTLLGVILIIGLGGMVPLWRRWGGEAFLPWITATGLLLVPPATAEFDYRYVLPTVPLACLAAAIAFSREPRERWGRMARWRGRGSAEAGSPGGEPEETTAEPAITPAVTAS
jgi:4-amino-4-deoxy-L-arabinose transferase-like glycosyltransferase